MHRITRIAFARPKLVSLILLCVTAWLGWGAAHVRTEFGYRVLVGGHHPAIRSLDNFIEEFGGGLPVAIAWRCGPDQPCDDAFDPASLELAHALTRELGVEAAVRRVHGIANAPILIPAEAGFAIRRFFENGELAADAAGLAERARRDPLWSGILISSEGDLGAILVQAVDTTSEADAALVSAIERAIDPHAARGFEFALTGHAIGSVLQGRSLAESSARLIPVTVLVIACVLFGLTRSWRFVVVALATLGVALVWTFGVLGWLDWPRDGILEVLAPLILVVGVCDAVHLLARFAELRGAQRAPAAAIPRRDRDTLLLAAARDVGPPCLVTSLTTATALLSFTASPLDTFQRFGCIAAFGVMACLLLTFSLLPLLARALPRRHDASAEQVSRPRTRSHHWDAAFGALLRFCETRARPILALTAALFVVCAIGWSQYLRVDTDVSETFGERSRFARWRKLVASKLQPEDALELRIALPGNEAFEDPRTLRALERFSERLQGVEGLDRVSSALDVIARVHRLLRDDDPAFERPGDSLAANAEILELVAFDDPDALASWLSLDRSSVRISATGRSTSASEQADIVEDVRRLIESELPPDWEVVMTGGIASAAEWIRDVSDTQLRSFPIAFACVFVLVAIFLRSASSACVAMVPTVLPVVVTLGALGLLGIRLDIGRAMLAAVLLGVGVDDAVHLLSHQRSRIAAGDTPREAMRAAVRRVGPAVVTTSLALSLGFSTLTLSAWHSISSFGVCVALAIAGACASALLVLPALVFELAADSRSARGGVCVARGRASDADPAG